MRNHGSHAHDVVDPALVSGLVVAVGGPERVDVLGYPALGGVHRVHLLVVAVPDDLGERVAAPGLAGQDDLVAPTQRLAVDVTLDERRSRGV